MNPIRTVNEWDDEYAKLARIAASQFRTTSSGYNTTTTNNKQQQSQGDIVQLFQQQLYRLDNALSSSTVVPTQITSTLSSTEIQRRKRLLQHLQQTSLPSGSAAGPIDLLGGDTTQQQQQQSNHNQQQQQSKISMAMRQQDDMIDQLAVGVNRLKQQTTIIGEEANMHLHLMNDIDTNLDSTYNTIHQQTQRAATLREDQSIWRLQLIVVVLVILLIFEILAGISP